VMLKDEPLDSGCPSPLPCLPCRCLVSRDGAVCLRFMLLEHLAAAVAWKAPMLVHAGPGSTRMPGPAL